MNVVKGEKKARREKREKREKRATTKEKWDNKV